MLDKLVSEIAETCLVTRARVLSRVVTGIYDDVLKQFGVNSPQLILLVIVARAGPVTRSAIGRFHHQERSTLTRNLRIMTDNGWIEEGAAEGRGRSRPLVLTQVGRDLLTSVEPAWREGQARTGRLLGPEGVHLVSKVGGDLLDWRALA